MQKRFSNTLHVFFRNLIATNPSTLIVQNINNALAASTIIDIFFHKRVLLLGSAPITGT